MTRFTPAEKFLADKEGCEDIYESLLDAKDYLENVLGMESGEPQQAAR
jgi:hypothetical protein